jgi:hypothetical protein
MKSWQLYRAFIFENFFEIRGKRVIAGRGHESIIPWTDKEEWKTTYRKFCKKESKCDFDRSRYCLLTVNPEPDTPVSLFKTLMERCIRKKWIKKSYYCFEWRDMNKGLHSHAVLTCEKKKRPSEMKREIYSTFKDIVGNEKHINIKPILAVDEYTRARNYLIGIKGGKLKKNNNYDIEYRKKYNLMNIYKNARRT